MIIYIYNIIINFYHNLGYFKYCTTKNFINIKYYRKNILKSYMIDKDIYKNVFFIYSKKISKVRSL